MLLTGLVAVLFAIFVWWLSTGLVLWVVRLPPFTQPWTLLCATLIMVASLFGLAASSDDVSLMGTYQAFTCAVLVWGWQEIGFLTGLVTGPRKEPLSKGARGATRLLEAIATILYHELALLGSGIAVFAVCWGGANQVGAWTFAVLWIMRLSAKLNLFLGVPNRSEQLLPGRLGYLATYFAHRPMNALFPVSVTGGTVFVMLIVQRIGSPDTSFDAAIGLVIVAALLALAVVEHWLLVLPLQAETLWRWSLASRAGVEAAPKNRLHGSPRPKLVALVNDQAIPSHQRGP